MTSNAAAAAACEATPESADPQSTSAARIAPSAPTSAGVSATPERRHATAETKGGAILAGTGGRAAAALAAASSCCCRSRLRAAAFLFHLHACRGA